MARGKGEGSIRQRSDGRWEGRITINEKRHSFYGDTRRDVVDQIKKAGEVEVETTELTVADYLQTRWLPNHVKVNRRYNTYVSYKKTVDNHIVPFIGARKLSNLLPLHASELMGRLEQADKSEHARRYAVLLLKMAFGQAKKDKVLKQNPLADFKVPKQPKTKIRSEWSEEDLAKFLKAASADDLQAFYVIAGTGGPRLSELLGLHWTDVDLTEGTVSIRRQLVRKKDADGKWSVHFDDVKTDAGKRGVPLSKIAVRALKAVKEKRLAQGLSANPLVFCTSTGTAYMPDNVRRSFRRAIVRAKVPRIRIHDLRHTCATLLLKKNVHPKIVQALLGHSDISVTMNLYSHVNSEMVKQAATKMNEVFG